MATTQKRLELRQGFSRALAYQGFTTMSKGILKGKTMTKEKFKSYGNALKFGYRDSSLSPADKRRAIRNVNILIDRY